MRGLPQDLVGKCLKSVLVRRHFGVGCPVGQVFLIFDDGTSYELWSDAEIYAGSSLDSKDKNEIEGSGPEAMSTIAAIG